MPRKLSTKADNNTAGKAQVSRVSPPQVKDCRQLNKWRCPGMSRSVGPEAVMSVIMTSASYRSRADCVERQGFQLWVRPKNGAVSTRISSVQVTGARSKPGVLPEYTNCVTGVGQCR